MLPCNPVIGCTEHISCAINSGLILRIMDIIFTGGTSGPASKGIDKDFTGIKLEALTIAGAAMILTKPVRKLLFDVMTLDIVFPERVVHLAGFEPATC